MSASVLPVAGTMRMHAAVPVGTNRIAIREKSCKCPECLEDVTTSTCDGWTIHTIRKVQEVMTEDNIDHNHNQEQIENREEVSNEGQMIPSQSQWATVNAEVGNFVACVYEKQWYVGRVVDKDIEEEEFKVQFMVKAGRDENVFKWPHPQDELWIPDTSVLRVIDDPQPSGRTKRMFKVEGFEEIENIFKKSLQNHDRGCSSDMPAFKGS